MTYCLVFHLQGSISLPSVIAESEKSSKIYTFSGVITGLELTCSAPTMHWSWLRLSVAVRLITKAPRGLCTNEKTRKCIYLIINANLIQV